MLVAAAVMLTSCRTDAVVNVVVDDSGAGTVTLEVTLDDEVVARLGDPAAALELDDAREAGWTVVGPTAGVGGTVISATKPFANPDQFAAVVAELGGESGVLRDFAYTRERSFGQTTYRIDGSIDLSGGLESFGDDALATTLGSPIGWSATDLEAELGGPAGEAFSLTVRADLPGDMSASGATVDNGVASWSPQLGDPPVAVRAEGAVHDRTPSLLAGLALAAAAVAIVVVVLGALSRRHRDRSAEQRGHRDGVPPPRPGRTDASSASAPGAGRVLVVGGHGALFTVPDVVGRLFGPFCRELGSRVPAAEISERYREATLGRLAPAELWPAVGVEGETSSLDREYLSRVDADDEALALLDRAADQGWATAVVVNDVGVWSQRLRRRFGLEDVVDHWVVSGDAGIRLPDPALYEAVRRRSGVSASAMVVVDSRLQFLDVAASLGAVTIWYRPPADAPRDRAHRHVWSFDEIDLSRF